MWVVHKFAPLGSHHDGGGPSDSQQPTSAVVAGADCEQRVYINLESQLFQLMPVPDIAGTSTEYHSLTNSIAPSFASSIYHSR